uniref:RNA polymerase beta subunit n=1 Tax=Chattonella marina TaxID=90936 RepID=UPI002113FC1F|nr:RNA polymerase beta subunit [Chattonella marina]UTE94811.1 RNA polymerase beta subunit [Chattonella marina]
MTKNMFISTLPNFLEIQRSSFCWFLMYGLSNELSLFPSIVDYGTGAEVRFFTQEFIVRKKINRTPVSCKQNNLTYGIRIFLPVQVINKSNNQERRKQHVFIGQLPLMTRTGTFIVNGCERVVVNQIIRCPGLYYKTELIKNRVVSSITIISQRGSWLKFEFDNNGCWVRVDKKYKSTIFDFLYTMGLTDDEIALGLKSEPIFRSYQDYQEYSKILEPNEFLSEASLELICSRLFDVKFYELGKIGRLSLNKRLGLDFLNDTKTITAQDIFAILDYFSSVKSFLPDDIDDLRNRRIRSVGELLENQFRIGLNRLEKNIAEKIRICDKAALRPSNIINPRPLVASIKEFFGSSQLSQYMDQINPLAELAHKRRISALGPGGLNADRVTLAARDIHPTQYGRICPIETPEGQNVGLVSTLSSYAKVNYNGFIETPYFKVKEGKILYDQPPIYLTAAEEEYVKIAAADVKRNSEGCFIDDVVVTKFHQEFVLTPPKEVELVSVSPIQIISVAASLIPFLEHNDANRALMGANMQRQAVPLLYPQKPIVGTGIELQITNDSGLNVNAIKPGIVEYVSSEKIIIKSFGKSKNTYLLNKYQRSNQDTCINQKPLVWVGEEVRTGQIIADGPATEGGELSLGQNLTVAYMPWEGYNFEDAILVSDKLVYANLFTSIHIEKYETEVQQTKTGPETVTSDIPFVNHKNVMNLDEHGVICVGTLVQPRDILVGKVTPKTEFDQLPEARLLKAIFGYKAPDVRDTSLRVPNGVSGRVIDVKIFREEKKAEGPVKVNSLIRVFIAQIRKIRVGDKIAGRHGNKGVISRILPHQDMPFLPDGTVVDIILNPLGVPSRMNVGQIFECLLGLAMDNLGKRFKIVPFDEMYQNEASRVLINQKLREAATKTGKPWLFNSYSPGKVLLTDGRTGEKFDNPILVGRSYILKLVHLVDDKIHSRSTGPYSLITQQPVGGRSQNGGQRFGEMEVWALEAFGAAYTLQELLTIKSDDMQGRDKVLNSIVCGQRIPKSGIPESFKVLIRELQSLGLDIKTYKLNKAKNAPIRSSKVDLMKTYETKFDEYLFT